VVYNNVSTNWGPAIASTGEVGWWLLPPVGVTDYVFNNLQRVLAPIEQNNVGSNGDTVGNYNYFNNTLEADPNQGIISCTYLSGGSLSSLNNLFITQGTPISGCTPTSATPLLLTNTQATTDGYTASQTYEFSPTSASSPTVGAGTNEQSICSIMLASSDPYVHAAGTACQSDTTYGCSYAGSGAALVCPARTPRARPKSTAWDIGAYQSGSAPSPPVKVAATVSVQ